MALNINREFISQRNINGTSNPCRYIVIHETDNFKSGANARCHAKAQSDGSFSDMSVHYYCGSDGVYQAAEHYCQVWHVGRTYVTSPNNPDCNNNNSIGIEICVNSDGNYNVARQNAIELVRHLVATTGIPASRVIRHYDAKGKYCPRNMMDNKTLWTDFKNQISNGSSSNATISVTEPITSKGGNTYMFELKQIQLGSKGTDVLLIQEILKARGYYGGALDRGYGNQTYQAVYNYQKDRKGACGTADGVCRAKTWADIIAL